MSELSGMTGFARVAGEAAWGSWAWEAKSVNGRSLDVRVNTPPGFDALERSVKAAASKLFNRGSLQVSLRIDMSTGDETVTVNEGLLTALTNAAQAIHGIGLSGEAIATLMTLKGVVETGGSSLRELAQDEAVTSLLADAAETALKELAVARRLEGASLTGIMTGLVGEMEGFAASAAKLAETQPGLLKARLQKQLDELDTEGRVDADRAAVEIALSAAKADVREELDRLAAHFAGARDLLAGGSPVGRKLDFLAQELNREANTLCSKSVSLDLTNAGLGLKGVIDQFKEQAANVE
jgi:uncharacterized protein (TIGR00255 family)